jgi:flagellar basal-body rod modification protein FlgD
MTATTPVNGNSSVYSSLGLTGNSGSGNSSAANASAASSAQAAASTALNEQDFLRLMTTQLQDQNPLQPVSNAEFFSQIAQFSTVSGINQLNGSFSTLASQLASSQSLQAASLVGQYVLVPGSTAPMDPTTGITGAVDVPSSGDVKVTVKDTSGAVVATLDLGTQSAGSLPFSWNGQDQNGNSLPSGNYSISATVSTGSGTTAASTEVAAQVTSVTLNGSSGLMLNLKGLGQVPFSQVTQII